MRVMLVTATGTKMSASKPLGLALTAGRTGAMVELMIGNTFWTEERRRVVSQTLFDVFKIEIGAAFASKFFIEFTAWVKALLTLVILATGFIAVLVFPGTRRKDIKEAE